MTPAPAERPAADARYLLWVVGGIALIVLNCVVVEYINQNYRRADLTFRYVPSTPEQDAAIAFYHAAQRVPWVAFGYALVGVCAFCRRGCAVVVWAALIACLPFPTWLADGLGRL